MARVDHAIDLLQAPYTFDQDRNVSDELQSSVEAFFQRGTPIDFTETANRLQDVSDQELLQNSYLTPCFVSRLIVDFGHLTPDNMGKMQAVLDKDDGSCDGSMPGTAGQASALALWLAPLGIAARRRL